MKILIYILLVFSVLGCSNNNASDQSNSKSNNYNSTNDITQNTGRSTPEALANETNVDDDAIGFLKMAGKANVFEIELSKLVQQKGVNTRVKNFSIMMERDHTKSLNELKALAADKNVLVNYSLNPDQKKHIQDLLKLNGGAFDKRYMQMMISSHTDNIKVFNSGADNRDKDVNRFANKTLPLLKEHIDSAKAIHASLK